MNSVSYDYHVLTNMVTHDTHCSHNLMKLPIIWDESMNSLWSCLRSPGSQCPQVWEPSWIWHKSIVEPSCILLPWTTSKWSLSCLDVDILIPFKTVPFLDPISTAWNILVSLLYNMFKWCLLMLMSDIIIEWFPSRPMLPPSYVIMCKDPFFKLGTIDSSTIILIHGGHLFVNSEKINMKWQKKEKNVKYWSIQDFKIPISLRSDGKIIELIT